MTYETEILLAEYVVGVFYAVGFVTIILGWFGIGVDNGKRNFPRHRK